MRRREREPHQIQFEWVEGHAGHPENEECDRLAVAAREKADLPEDEGFVLPEKMLVALGLSDFSLAIIQTGSAAQKTPLLRRWGLGTPRAGKTPKNAKLCYTLCYFGGVAALGI